MERDEVEKTYAPETSDAIDRCAVNSLILDYYKKFGRKRDLEQYFSLTTAQSDIKDTSGTFWRKMKSENDSSDSGDRKSESSHEVCRISIRCSLPEPSSSQDDEQNTKTDSPHTESPPIIIEEVPANVSRHTDEESVNFDDNHSQKSLDALLDLSTHKPLSPTSSITSQRKLEWDSLADVGYGNESDRKNSASSLSTLERLALKQQYSNNDTKQDIGAPTSHSTPLEEGDSKSKVKKGLGKKTTKIYKKDVDFLEVNVPHTSDAIQTPSINVNLTKHISFNVEKDGAVTIDNIKRDLNISPEKEIIEPAYLGMDKEIQTTLPKEKSSGMDETPKAVCPYDQKIPVMISLNTLRKRLRRKKARVMRKKLRTKKKVEEVKEVTPQEKSGEQLSEAESFEYMPGHMYNQNQIKDNEPRLDNSTAGNKSSLESSGPPTTDSSKDSKHSLTKDLEKCLDLLKITLQKRYNDGDTKKKLIKEIVHRLVNSRYRDDDTTTEFLSGLNFDSAIKGLKGNNTTTSTSDANTSEDNKHKSPKKSILRNEKFNPNVASTSQSAPNLYSPNSEKVKTTGMKKTPSFIDSDASSREKSSSDNAFPKTSSEELYLKYLEAVRREASYKRHLKEKEMFLKQKLASSESSFKVPISQQSKVSGRLKDLMKDLTRNNYDDGSGDASKLEGGSSSNLDIERINTVRNHRSHSVFTLSSSHSDGVKRPNLKKKMQAEKELSEAGPSKDHYCCCPHHYLNSKVHYADSSVQVNINDQSEAATKYQKPSQMKPHGTKKNKPVSPRNTRVVPDNVTGEIKYVCLCNGKPMSSSDVEDSIMIYKCSRLTNRGVQLEDPIKTCTGVQCESVCKSLKNDNIELIQPPCTMNTATESSSSSDYPALAKRFSKSSQTNVLLKICHGGSENQYSSGSDKNLHVSSTRCIVGSEKGKTLFTINEATRCLQTEISINPKISDASVSDINIVNDCDCVKFIGEQQRQFSVSDSENSFGRKTFSDVCTNSASDRLIRSEDSIFRKESKPSKADTNVTYAVEKTNNGHSTVAVETDSTLPILRTGVNTGKVESDTPKKQEQVNVKICENADKAPSINEECTKSLRFSKETPVSTHVCYMTENNLSENVAKRNTYPKKDPIKRKPPLKRSNTDTDKLVICRCLQTDAETNNNQKDFLENEPITKVATSDNACQVETQKSCDECFPPKIDKRIALPENPNPMNLANLEYRKHVGIQKDLSDKEDDKLKTPVEKCEKADTETSKVTCKSVGCETESENKIIIGCCVSCQTEAQQKEEILGNDPKICSSDSQTKNTQDKPTKEACGSSLLQDSSTKDLTEKSQKETCCSKESCPKKSSENLQKEACCSKRSYPETLDKDPVIDLIQNITRRYSKTDIVKIKKKKCFTEIMTVLNYLLETDDSTDPEPKVCYSTSTDTKSSCNKNKKHKLSEGDCCSDRQVDKSIQMSCRKTRIDTKLCTESSDLPCSSDLPTTSSDSAACKVLKKIKKECEKYHLKKCKSGRKCEISSSTSANCEKCNKIHHCPCRNHKCKRTKAFEKLQKKCVAYNLIIQTSESMLSEETICEKKSRPLQNIIVKVPKRKDKVHKEATFKEQGTPRSPPCGKNRPQKLPNDSETSDEYAKRIEMATVREYLEQNRPDFVENTSQRQNCLKFISERRANERAAHKKLLLLLERQPDLTNLSSDQLRQLAQQIGLDLRRRQPAPNLISERDMKRHSEKIYKTLPEVVQKKEEKRKENIKKTNLLMANIFKRNLQNKVLQGFVNLSNYSPVIKI